MSSLRAVILLCALLCATPALAKRCVFLHGSGLTDVGEPTSTFPSYWGDVHEHVSSFCTETLFNHDETVHYRWDDHNLMKRYCALASDGTGVVKDTAVFTHSMGNLIFASALRQGICSLDSTSTWWAVSPPWHGSKAADVVEAICMDPSKYSEGIRALAEIFHYCESSSPGNASLSYLSMQTDDEALVNAQLDQVMARYASGGICGDSDYGLTSKYSLAFEALALIVEYGEENDGMVPMSSCALSDRDYDDSYTAAYYKGHLNHADTTCRNGDGDFGFASRQPCKWYGSRY